MAMTREQILVLVDKMIEICGPPRKDEDLWLTGARDTARTIKFEAAH